MIDLDAIELRINSNLKVAQTFSLNQWVAANELAALIAELRAARILAEVVRTDLQNIATMPWRVDDHEVLQWTCLDRQIWKDWIHGTHELLHEALAAYDKITKEQK